MNLELTLIETPRLWLRPLELEDTSDLFMMYGDERVVDENFNHPPIEDIDALLQSIRSDFLAYRQKGVPPSMVLELKDTGRVIGVIDFHTVRDEIGEIGYTLCYDYWNQGYMSEACIAMVKLGFEVIGFHRIEATCSTSKLASSKVLEHSGFQREGILRSYIKLNDGYYHDVFIYSIIKEDYEKYKGETI